MDGSVYAWASQQQQLASQWAGTAAVRTNERTGRQVQKKPRALLFCRLAARTVLLSVDAVSESVSGHIEAAGAAAACCNDNAPSPVTAAVMLLILIPCTYVPNTTSTTKQQQQRREIEGT